MTADLMTAIDKFADRLQSDLAQSPGHADQAEVEALIERLRNLKAEASAGDADAIGTTFAQIKQSVYDGAFDSPEPGRAYVEFQSNQRVE